MGEKSSGGLICRGSCTGSSEISAKAASNALPWLNVIVVDVPSMTVKRYLRVMQKKVGRLLDLGRIISGKVVVEDTYIYCMIPFRYIMNSLLSLLMWCRDRAGYIHRLETPKLSTLHDRLSQLRQSSESLSLKKPFFIFFLSGEVRKPN